MKRPLKWVAKALGMAVASDREVTGWSIDSRTLQPGDLFFAIQGPNHDGHLYAAEVLKKGAAAVVVDRDVAVSPALRVNDVLKAMQSLASDARGEWGGELVAVTGSAGKTTTKEVIAAMLAGKFATAKNEGNLNNHVGLPLSLLRIPESARLAVVEMGMNHAGEIRTLAGIARPQVGVVTNVGSAHIENFESIEGIAASKRELVEALGASGIAVLNADDRRVNDFAHSHAGRVVRYGQSEEADVRAEDVAYSAYGTSFRVGDAHFEMALTGRHSVSNVLAGIAVAGIYGISAAQLTAQVRELQPEKMRGERFRHRDVLVYNDCYNSNPDAVRAMLDVLRDTPARRKIAVLGEMLELGHWAERLHRDVGIYAAECQVDVLVGIRGAASYMLDAALGAGLRADAAFFFDEPDAAGELVKRLAHPGDAILFKGSRGVRVEKALARFLASDPETVGGET